MAVESQDFCYLLEAIVPEIEGLGYVTGSVLHGKRKKFIRGEEIRSLILSGRCRFNLGYHFLRLILEMFRNLVRPL